VISDLNNKVHTLNIFFTLFTIFMARSSKFSVSYNNEAADFFSIETTNEL